MGIEGSGMNENLGTNEESEILNYDLGFLVDFQNKIETQARDYVLKEQASGRDITELTGDLNNLVEKQRGENETLEKQIVSETKERLDKEALINEAKVQIYEKCGINENQEQNSAFENFSKGFIDEVVLGNYDMAVEVINTNGKIILDVLKQLASWKGLKQIAEALGESIGDLFTGNAYERGKAIAEIGLVGTGIGLAIVVGKKGFKLGMKQISKLRVNKESLVNSPDIKNILSDTTTKIDYMVPKKQFDFESMTVEDISKLKNSADRVGAGKSYLGGKDLTPNQEKAIIDAHNVGSTREGAGIYNYTFREKGDKLKILEEAGFTKQERKILLDKGVCGISEDVSEIISRHKELFGENIDNIRVLGEGVNAVVVDRLDGTVVKMRKSGEYIDDIGYEIKNHNIVGNIIREGKNKGLIDISINIPEILTVDPGYLKSYFIMEKIEGQTISSKIFRNEHKGLKLESSDYLDTFTDRELIDLMIDKYGSSTEYLRSLRDMHSEKYLNEGMNFKGSPLKNALKYLKENGIEHTDLHTGNIMIDKSGKIYIIDFGTVKI